MSLTKRQRRILDYIKEFTERRGYAPSLMEIARHFGLRSPATVHKHLRNLEAKGVLRRRWNHSRAIEVLPEEGTTPAYDLPLVGVLAADQPPQLRPSEQTVPVPAGLVGNARTYVLRVSGDGFRDELVRDGDLVIIEDSAEPPDGAVVLAVVAGARSFLHRYHKNGQRVRLEPVAGNRRMLEVGAGDVRVHGQVRGVLRQY